jgi:hypothetical protein
MTSAAASGFSSGRERMDVLVNNAGMRRAVVASRNLRTDSETRHPMKR